MTDKELIEFAAKAYNDGYFFGFDKDGNGLLDPVVYSPFNPLTNDGDALRLAVNLGIDIEWQHDSGYVKVYRNKPFSAWNGYISELFCVGDAMAATRRAITRAAAQIGKEME